MFIIITLRNHPYMKINHPFFSPSSQELYLQYLTYWDLLFCIFNIPCTIYSNVTWRPLIFVSHDIKFIDLLTITPHTPSTEPVRYDKKEGQWYSHDAVNVKGTPQKKGKCFPQETHPLCTWPLTSEWKSVLE